MTIRDLVAAGLLCLGAANLAPGQTQRPALTEPEQQIVKQLKGLRAVPDDLRGQSTRKIAHDIQALPVDAAKVQLAFQLANLSTEGDFGRNTLQDVGTTLAGAMREQPAQSDDMYLELAQLARYEGVKIDWDTPRLRQAEAQLESEDRDRAAADFTLKDLQGKEWHLKDLRGKVVLVNFWATWCPPCRKEMPDLDSLYRQFKDQGLVVLAISDEEADKVTPFLTAHPISYPVLLDAGRKVNDAFHVSGIPKSFVYDRSGQLVAQSIDMRTRGQFLGMLSRAGLQTGVSGN